ncbi:MAG: FGGY-family carbohydrate kinase [Oscillospiraceae bacterium]|nr:FGGY-family carbohydrate kinase [Oscillospiraceae bacterium]
MNVISYDVGTTGFKAALFDISRESGIRLVAGDVEHYSLRILPNGGAEQNPNDWWNAMRCGTKKLLEKTGISKEKIEGISFCSQFATLVMVDEQGNALRPAMSTMDIRGAPQFHERMQTGLCVEGLNVGKLLRFLKITGAASTSAKDTIWRYHWVRENEPETFRKTYKWLDAKEYLTFRATGRIAASRDDAYMTFLYDVKAGDWSDELCKMLHIEKKHLPALCHATDKVGTLLPGAAEELGLAPGTAVISGGSDISLCQVGSGCLRPGDVNICSGTSGWVCTTVDHMCVDVGHSVASLVGADPETYLYCADCETAGKCVEWGKERLSHTPIATFDEMIEHIKDTPAGSNGVVFSPWMHGNRCPFEDANARGVFFNVDVDNRSSDLVKAVIEGVCLHMRWLLEISERKVKTSPSIRFTGGSAVSPEVCQILADVLGRKVEIIEHPRYVGTIGAAGLLAVSFGILDNMQSIRDCIPLQAEYLPRPGNTAVYDRIYPVFQELYWANKKSFSALNKVGAAGKGAEAVCQVK